MKELFIIKRKEEKLKTLIIYKGGKNYKKHL